VLIGKIIPYILFGYVQVTGILLAGRFLFGVPMEGSLDVAPRRCVRVHPGQPGHGHHVLDHRGEPAASGADVVLRVPAVDPAGGFMFPFRGMPRWAQYIGEVLPITHFLRVVRGVMLKGNGPSETLHELWPIALFALVALTIAVKRYRQTLD
jgi:ABC-2 type transport system permease protein